MAELTYYLRINGKIMGPLPMEKLQALKERGRLLAEHEVSQDRRQWARAATVPELFGGLAAESPDAGSATDPWENQPLEPSSSVDDDWFYSVEGEQMGPVPWRELRRLARSGQLDRDDLVWQAGLDDWQPARSVSGLFQADAARRRKTKSKPTDSERGVWSLALNTIRQQVTSTELESISRNLIRIGSWAMVLAMITGPLYLVLAAVKDDSISHAAIGCISFFGLGVLKYLGERLSIASHELVRASPNRLSSTAFLDATATVLIFAGLCGAVYLVLLGVQMPDGVMTLTMTVVASQLAVVCLYAACTALQPAWLNIDCSSGATAGEEGIGVVAFLLKLCLRLAPVQFGSWAVVGSIGMTVSLLLLMLDGQFRTDAAVLSTASWGLVASAGLAPLGFYLLMIFVSVALDLAQSILSVPSHLSRDPS